METAMPAAVRLEAKVQIDSEWILPEPNVVKQESAILVQNAAPAFGIAEPVDISKRFVYCFALEYSDFKVLPCLRRPGNATVVR
jgi:hypothetical protein